jgi:hypothetical protein
MYADSKNSFKQALTKRKPSTELKEDGSAKLVPAS